MKRIVFALFLMGAPPAALAQTPAPASPVDPARLVVARDLVAQMITDESMQRMFGGLDKALSSQFITSMVPAGDLAKARAADPYLDERLKRVSKVVLDYLREMMVEMLPDMRALMAISFARKLPEDELRADLAFARTPTGRHLFASFYDVMQDPAYASFVQNMAQRFGGARTGLVDRMKAATADLPPPPKPAK